jgi:5-methylcytosine-specific restriction endonuclease McrA
MTDCKWPRCICKATGEYCSNRKITGKKEPKPIPKRSEKGKKKAIGKKELLQTDMAFYLLLWQERSPICFNCSTPITFSILVFDHILEKADKRYAHLRHEPDNICLLCPDCHNSKTANVWNMPKLLELRKSTLNRFGLPEEEEKSSRKML